MKIYLHHCRSIPMPGRKSGYCVQGMHLFAARHGLTMRQLVDGIDAEVLLATGDAMAERIVQWAESMEAEQCG